MISILPSEAQPPFALTIDLGSSSVRASLYDALGRQVGDFVSRRKWNMPVTAAGAAEADPGKLLAMVIEVIDEEAAKCGDWAQHIAGVGMSSLAGNILGIDGDSNAVTPLTTYADTRAAQMTRLLRQELNEVEIHNRTGCPFHPAYLPARFRWMQAERPQWLTDAVHWVTIGEYIQLKLLGQAHASYSMTSWNGLLNLREATYDEELLQSLPVSTESFLPLADSDQGVVGLSREYAQRWPVLKDVPWFAPIGDGAAANIGSGCTTDQQVALTIGTSSAVRVVLHDVPDSIPQGLWCYRIDSEHVLLGGALSEGGSVYAWMRDTLQLNEIADMEEALAAIAPDSHGLTILPLFRGERSPGYQAKMRGSIVGIGVSTQPIHLMRAALEGVSYRIGQLVDLLEEELGEDASIIASGGAVQTSEVWDQILADVINRPLTVSQVAEASSRGVALATLQALGVIELWEDVPAFTGQTFQPDSEAHQIYHKAMARQQSLYNWQRDALHRE